MVCLTGVRGDAAGARWRSPAFPRAPAGGDANERVPLPLHQSELTPEVLEGGRSELLHSLFASSQDLLDHSGLAQLLEAFLDGLQDLYYDVG